MGHIIVEGVRISTDHYIGGERVSSTRTFEDISPIDETTLGHVASGGSAEIEATVTAAQKAFPAWAALGPQGRGVYLRRFADIIEAHVEDLAAVETIDNGSLLEASRLRVMKRSAHNIRFFATYADNSTVKYGTCPIGMRRIWFCTSLLVLPPLSHHGMLQ